MSDVRKFREISKNMRILFGSTVFSFFHMAPNEKLPEAEKPDSPKSQRSRPSGDLRTLVLMLVLTLLIFGIFLFKMQRPTEYAESVGKVKEGA